jgi:hypothetical protein
LPTLRETVYAESLLQSCDSTSLRFPFAYSRAPAPHSPRAPPLSPSPTLPLPSQGGTLFTRYVDNPVKPGEGLYIAGKIRLHPPLFSCRSGPCEYAGSLTGEIKAQTCDVAR